VGRGWRNLIPVLAGGVLLAGCGPTAPAPTAGVRGLVTFQGRPLGGGVIVFAPDADRGSTGKPISGAIDLDGRYHLTDGTKVPPGWYRVAIADQPATGGDYSYGPRFPVALRRPDRSGLSREVLAGRDNVFDFYIDVPE
jgi:hypothetical protein